MRLQFFSLRNLVENSPNSVDYDPNYISHTVVEETPLVSYDCSICPAIGDAIRVDGETYVVISREFVVNMKDNVSLSIKIRCYQDSLLTP